MAWLFSSPPPHPPFQRLNFVPPLFPRRYGTLAAGQILVKLPGSLYPQAAKTNFPSGYTYAAPVVTTISQPPSIFGQSTLVVNGTNFGPVGVPISPNVSISTNSVVTSNVTDCYVKVAHVSIACTVTCFSPCTANYVGGKVTANSTVTVSRNGLNGTSAAILAFEGPVINGIRGSTTQLVSL